MTLYLLDANVLIRAHADYYPIDRIKPFWEWLLGQADTARVKMPREIYDEVGRPTSWASGSDSQRSARRSF